MLGIALYAAIWVTQVAWAVMLARRAGPTYHLARYNRFWIYLAFFILSSVVTNILARPIRSWVIEPFKIPSAAMIPTLLPGDQVFVVKVGPVARWTRGDLVIYPAPDAPAQPGEFDKKIFIKRVIAVGGDRVEVQSHQVRVNSSLYEQEPCAAAQYAYVDDGGSETNARPVQANCFVERTPEGRSYSVIYQTDFDSSRGSYGPTAMGGNEVFVMGDNRDNSLDSRFTGPVEANEVLGRAVVIWFSFSLKDGIRWQRMGTRL